MKRQRIFDRLEKLARIGRQSRNDVNDALDGARGQFGASKSQLDEAQQKLDALQQEVEQLTQAFEDARTNLLELTNLSQIMDLTGATEARDRKGLRTFMVGGKEHEIDAGDLKDIKMTPFSKKKKESEEDTEDTNDSDDGKKKETFTADVSLADDPDLAFASDIIESTAKLRFR
jgi:multidrug efflux pump subunit AcrA (membrane-fusion protein)